MSRMSVEVLLKGVTPTIGEGPHWDDKTQSLIFVDILSHTVYIWDSNSGKLESKTLGKYFRWFYDISNVDMFRCLCRCCCEIA